jgi:hypothetical protein
VNGVKGYETVEGLAPNGADVCRFFIAKQRIEHFKINGPEYKFWEIFSMVETLKSPLIIAEGLKREGLELGLCYIGKPRKHRDGVDHPPPPGMVFLVCMTPDFKIFEWRWEPEDCSRANYPNDGKRFTKIKWKR